MSVTVGKFHIDGFRGPMKAKGHWTSAEKAVLGVGCEWWSAKEGAIVNGRSVELRQYDTYDDNRLVEDHDKKPIWEYGNGDMYLGTWAMDKKLRVPVEQGFGIFFNFNPEKFHGLIYIGHWQGGHPHGMGKSFWLETSPRWIKNHYSASAVWPKKPKGTGRGREQGIPIIYEGNFDQRIKCDPHALVTLKDGTTRRGPWKNNKPVGDWWTQHFDPSNQDDDDDAAAAAVET